MATVGSHKQELLVAGYVREIEIMYKLINIPVEIIDIIYLFQQFCDVWNKQYIHKDILLDSIANTITFTSDIKVVVATAYGTNMIEDGIHKWKIKILSISSDVESSAVPLVGIIKSDEQVLKKYLDNPAWEYDGYQFCAGSGFFYGMNNPNDRKDVFSKLTWNKANDILHVILDLNQGTLQFGINEEDPMIVWGKDGQDCIEKGKYRLALSCAGFSAQFQLL